MWNTIIHISQPTPKLMGPWNIMITVAKLFTYCRFKNYYTELYHRKFINLITQLIIHIFDIIITMTYTVIIILGLYYKYTSS